jgi:hypothetical protein
MHLDRQAEAEMVGLAVEDTQPAAAVHRLDKVLAVVEEGQNIGRTQEVPGDRQSEEGDIEESVVHAVAVGSSTQAAVADMELLLEEEAEIGHKQEGEGQNIVVLQH